MNSHYDTSYRITCAYRTEDSDYSDSQKTTPPSQEPEENASPPAVIGQPVGSSSSSAYEQKMQEMQQRHEERTDWWLDRAQKGRDQLQKYKQRIQNNAARKAGKTGVEAGEKVLEQGTKAAVRTGARTAAVAGAEVAAETVGAATGPVGWAVDAGIILLDLSIRALGTLRSAKVRWILFFTMLFFLFILLFIGVVLSGGYQLQCDQQGPNPRGARCYTGTSDAHDSTVLSHDEGLTAGYSIDSLDAAVKKVRQLIASRSGNADAQRILGQIDDLKTKIESSSYAADDKYIRDYLDQYRKLVIDLLGAVYPERKAGLAKVTPLLGNKVVITGFCKGAETDLKSLRLDENLYNLIATLGNQRTIKIECLVSDHRKYVGMPPIVRDESGKVIAHNPICGQAETRSGPVKISHHCFGIAMDLAPDSGLETLLQQMKSQGTNKIMYLADEGNHLHVEVYPETKS